MKKIFKTKIIAEAGVNHNGSLIYAKRLVDIAKKANCDFVKFQAFKTDEITTQYAKKTDYQKKNKRDSELQYQMLKKLELNKEQFVKIKKYCDKKKIKFLCTAFDVEYLEFILKLNVKLIKIPSGEINNIFLLKKAAKSNKPILLSTGAANTKDIFFALKILKKSKNKIYLMQCSSAYPTPVEFANINVVKSFLKIADGVGYSDHTLGNEAAICATAFGATFIEKHFTISKKLNGPDHKMSLNPKELISFVKSIRNAEMSLGSNLKFINKYEKKNLKFIRRVIVANQNIKKNEKFTINNLSIKRTSFAKNCFSPKDFFKLINKKSKKNYLINEKIQK